MAKKKPPEEHENLERWLVSYGDFITLLFATFVVLYALSQVDISEFTKMEQSMKRAFNPSFMEGSDAAMDAGNNLVNAQAADSVITPLMLEYVSQRYESQSYEEIKDAIEKMEKNGDLEGVGVEINDSGLLVTFKNDLLFYSASATLTDKAMKTLDIVGVLIAEKFALHYIRVEGHTDNQPINTFMFPSNWELSSARSSAIVRYLISRFKFMPQIFSAVGYADTRPIVDNKTAENRAKNRRVELLILKNQFRNLEHSSTEIFKQSRKSQEEFQAERMATIQRVKDGSKAFNKVQTSDIEDATENMNLKRDLNKYVKPEQDSSKSISIQNKTLYEQASQKNQSINTDRILENDINNQFKTSGQE